MFARPYAQPATIDGIVLVGRGVADYAVNPTILPGDVQISQDGGVFFSPSNLPVAFPSGSTSIRANFTATELTCKRLVVRFICQALPKRWEDQEMIIETYGNVAAQDPRSDLLTLTDGIENGITVKQALRACLAILTGLVSGYPAGPGIFKAPDGATPRVTVTNDQYGNRLTVTLNL